MKNSKVLWEEAKKLESDNKYQEALNIYIESGLMLRNEWNLDEALKFLKQALKILDMFRDKDTRCRIQIIIGTIFLQMGKIDNAYKYYTRALEIAKATENKGLISSSYNNIGQIYERGGDLEKALQYMKKSLEIEEILGNKSEVAVCLNNIGHINEQRGDLDEALQYYQRSLEIDRDLGREKFVAIRLSNIGSIHKIKGIYDEALKYIREALSINERLGNIGGMASNLNHIGVILNRKGEVDKALKYIKKALKLNEKTGYVRKISTCLNNIGLILEQKGQSDEALKYFKKALKINEELGDKSGKATNLHNIGIIYAHRNEFEEALRFYKKALNLVQKQIEGKEVDYKSGKIFCPNIECQAELVIYMLGRGAVIEICPNCQTKFSIWSIDQNSSKYQVGIISKGVSASKEGDINFQEKTGRKIETEISEWLDDGAAFTFSIAETYRKMKRFIKACDYYFYSASMSRGLGRINESNSKLSYIVSILPKIDEITRYKYLHEIDRIRKLSSDIIRSREFAYMFIACPNCHDEHQIQVIKTTIAIEICKICGTKFSVYFSDTTQEFYTNILDNPIKKSTLEENKTQEEIVKFCARCGLNLGILPFYCPRCGLKIFRLIDK
ncbi:MAG: tetratricopeptide repeat protein [Candidatus Hodarchaeales archaeon]|jgi:tetratricopeptide (TPR) repeat protein